MSAADAPRALDAVERLVNRGAEVDETLRDAVAALHERVREYAWVGVSLRGRRGAGTRA